ncbi:MAG: NUDIX domain-containing protein [Pseudomonadota bacterium]
MLQQTQIERVKTYFHHFIQKWPTPQAMAEADPDDVLAAWSGLGYYRRARNLHRAACMIVERFGGFIPSDEERLRELPGLGDYSAAAIAAIAFHRQAVAIDGNIERVGTRIFALKVPMPAGRDRLKAHLHEAMHTVPAQASEFTQALMDLGAMICRPVNPACHLCPLGDHCLGREQAHDFPVKARRKKRSVRYACACVLDYDRHIALVRRPPAGILGGMWVFPDQGWRDQRYQLDPDAFGDGLHHISMRRLDRDYCHHFTHVELHVTVFRCSVPSWIALPPDWRWFHLDQLDRSPVPALTRNLIGKACLV